MQGKDAMRNDEMKTKRCKHCNIVKNVVEFYSHKSGRLAGRAQSYCKSCHKIYSLERSHLTGQKRPLQQAKDCASYLGVFVAETALSKFFDHIKRMPYGHPGFDFICGREFKIDVKSACMSNRPKGSPGWSFQIKKNQIADYFLCVAFDNRDALNPRHVWLMPGNTVNALSTIFIRDRQEALEKWSRYERSLDRVITHCNSRRMVI